MPRKSTRRCSVKKLFKTIDSDHSGSSITLSKVKSAFKKATKPLKRKSLTDIKLILYF
jgi:hypothetical protein